MSFFAEEKLDTEIIDNIHDAPVNLLNPAKGAVTNNMNSNYIDPKEGQEEVKQEEQEQQAEATQAEAEKGEE